jgi:hypothetical protein
VADFYKASALIAIMHPHRSTQTEKDIILFGSGETEEAKSLNHWCDWKVILTENAFNGD